MISSVVGSFVVLRGQLFAGHALTDVATAGGTGAVLLGTSTLTGFLVAGLSGAGAIEAIGADRVRERNIATGIVLGAATGLSALFVYLTETTTTSSSTSAVILFGSLFTISNSVVPVTSILGTVAVITTTVMARPLSLSSLSIDLARSRGVKVRLVGWTFMATVAVTVGLASLVVGSILATALLIGPAAAAQRLSSSLTKSVLVASVFGVTTTWAGILLAYDSYDWTASHRSLPVSFCVVTVTVIIYVISVGVSRVSTFRHPPKVA